MGTRVVGVSKLFREISPAINERLLKCEGAIYWGGKWTFPGLIWRYFSNDRSLCGCKGRKMMKTSLQWFPSDSCLPPKKSITPFRLPFLFAHRSQTVICIAAVGQKQQRFCDLLPILWPTKMAVSSKYWHCPFAICHHRKDGCNVWNDPHRSICHQLSWFEGRGGDTWRRCSYPAQRGKNKE